jgi:transcriptional regulator with XRE-family HTH domain
MEMKLNSKLIRELRLARSWTQEQLAEKARLNPRTIQRVEMDGQGSLRTRAQLAIALGVSPAELDVVADTGAGVAVQASGWRPALQDYMNSMSLHTLVLQLLVTLFFLGSAPSYMSIARNGFGMIWGPRVTGMSLPQQPAWWVVNLAMWALLSAPLFTWIWKRQRQWFWRASVAALATLFLSVLRLWEVALVVDLVTRAVFFAGLILLACQWLPRVPRIHAEHLLYGCLYAYVYLSCFLQFAGSGAVFAVAAERGWPHPYDGDVLALFKELMAQLGGLTELLPVICVWLLGRGQRSRSASSGLAQTRTEQSVEPPAKEPAGPFLEQHLLEN